MQDEIENQKKKNEEKKGKEQKLEILRPGEGRRPAMMKQASKNANSFDIYIIYNSQTHGG